MNYSTAATLGALRGVWAVTGVRGGYANAWYVSARVGFDQTVENATGVGAPPASWPTSEKTADALHKAFFSTVSGTVADRLLRRHQLLVARRRGSPGIRLRPEAALTEKRCVRACR